MKAQKNTEPSESANEGQAQMRGLLDNLQRQFQETLQKAREQYRLQNPWPLQPSGPPPSLDPKNPLDRHTHSPEERERRDKRAEGIMKQYFGAHGIQIVKQRNGKTHFRVMPEKKTGPKRKPSNESTKTLNNADSPVAVGRTITIPRPGKEIPMADEIQRNYLKALNKPKTPRQKKTPKAPPTQL